MRVVALIVLGVVTSPGAAGPKPFPGTRGTWGGFAKYEFAVDGARATVVVPARPLAGRPWLWRGEQLGGSAAADSLVKEGWHLVYLDVPDLFGSPKAVAKWERLYALLTKE